MQNLVFTYDIRSITVQRSRRPSRPGGRAPAEAPRWKGAEGRDKL